MAILRNASKGKYTVLNNGIFRDENLSAKSLGILAKMLSLPDNWEFSETGLCSIFKKDGRDSIRSGLKELEENGYLVRIRVRDDSGKLTSVEWTVSDRPMFEKPMLENPMLENPMLENRTQYNTKEYNTKEFITKEFITKDIPPISPKGKTDCSDLFNKFWTAYPKHIAKQSAVKAFEKLKPDEKLLEAMLKAIARQKESKQWEKDGGAFIPYPATWLNQRRWEDELPQVETDNVFLQMLQEEGQHEPY